MVWRGNVDPFLIWRIQAEAGESAEARPPGGLCCPAISASAPMPRCHITDRRYACRQRVASRYPCAMGARDHGPMSVPGCTLSASTRRSAPSLRTPPPHRSLELMVSSAVRRLHPDHIATVGSRASFYRVTCGQAVPELRQGPRPPPGWAALKPCASLSHSRERNGGSGDGEWTMRYLRQARYRESAGDQQ